MTACGPRRDSASRPGNPDVSLRTPERDRTSDPKDDRSSARLRGDDAPVLTHVELLWIRKQVENRIRFGRSVDQHIIDRQWRVVSFEAGSIFAFVRWAGNEYGTTLSRVDILRAVAPGERYITVPYVRPGGQSLLRICGWPKVEKVLQAIDAIEALGIDPADAAPEHWQHVHNRVSVRERPRPYTKARHQAWLHRRKLIS